MEINYPRKRTGKTGAVGVKRVQETRQAMAARRAEMKGCAPDEEATGGSQENTESQDSGEGDKVCAQSALVIAIMHVPIDTAYDKNIRRTNPFTMTEDPSKNANIISAAIIVGRDFLQMSSDTACAAITHAVEGITTAAHGALEGKNKIGPSNGIDPRNPMTTRAK